MYLIWCLLASTFCLADPKVYMGEAQRAFLDWAFLHRQELGTAGALKMSAAPKRPKGKKTQGLTLNDHKIILWPWWDEKKTWVIGGCGRCSWGPGVKTNGYIEAGQRWRLIWDDDQDEDDVGGHDNDDDDDDQDGDDIHILWWSVCVLVCHQKSSLPPWSLL